MEPPLISGFYGPSAPPLALVAVYIAIRARHTAPLAFASLIIIIAALALLAYGERLMRVAALMMPLAVVASLLEAGHRRVAALALVIYLAGPIAAGWAWATGHLDGLFAPVQRITPAQLYAYQQALKHLPPHAHVNVMWQLDLWLLPLAKAVRPDLTITDSMCNWSQAQYYIYTPPDPHQWYLPCILTTTPPPGTPIAKWGNTTLYESIGANWVNLASGPYRRITSHISTPKGACEKRRGGHRRRPRRTSRRQVDEYQTTQR